MPAPPSQPLPPPPPDPRPAPPAPRTPLDWFAAALGARRDELPLLSVGVGAGFFLFTAYSIMKPLRDEVGTAFGKPGLARLTTGTFLLMAVATLTVGASVSLLGWKRFFIAAQGFWIVGTLAFALAFAAFPEARAGWLGAAFFMCVSVFNLLSLSFLWSRLTDVCTPDQAKRLFPIIGLGVTLGGIVGATVVATLAKTLAAPTLLFVAAGLLVGVLGAAILLTRRSDARPVDDSHGYAVSPGTAAKGAVEALVLVARSTYLLRLALYIFLYATTGTILYFQQRDIVSAAAPSGPARAAAFASIDLYTNIATITLQALAAGRILRFIGVGAALTITPVTTALGIATLWLAPQLTPLIAVQVSRRALHYSLDRPAREVLYTVLSSGERHKAKGFIDTFAYRLGDQAGAWMQAGLAGIGAGAAGVYAAVAACALWGVLGLTLGVSLKHKQARVPGSLPAPAPGGAA